MSKPPFPLKKSEWCVRDCALADARDLVERFHYARGGSNTRIFTHGLYHIDDPDTAVGVAWWIPPTKAAALSVDPDWTGVITLTRLVVAPGCPTNAASYLLGQSIRRIRQDGRFHTLLTYADAGQGHTGSIYLATNWTYLGSRPGDPVWVDPQSGRHVARKAGPKTRTKSEMTDLGYVSLGRSPKHKFVMRLR